jgi:putative PIN family toxin of toxin-antitoxin system
LRVVLDTNTLIRAHGRSPSRARHLLRTLLERGDQLILSNEILAEVTRVLRYPRFQEMFGLTDADLLEYVQFLQSIAVLVPLELRYNAPLRDPQDLMVMQTAERGEADILCTQDDDFHTQTMATYCAARGIEVCDESALIERLGLL